MDAAEIEREIVDGEKRVEIALHYGIAYPRLEHAPYAGGSEAKAATTGVPLLPDSPHVLDSAHAAHAALRSSFAKPINIRSQAARAKNRQKMMQVKTPKFD